jgi:hypothetical protein
MKGKIEDFIDNVIEGLVVGSKLKKRIAADLQSHINEALISRNEDNVLDMMGSPAEVAREFMDSIYENKNEVIERLIRERLRIKRFLSDYFEYRSKVGIFGIPLLNIRFRRHQKAKPATAKGIIAVGDRAIGVVAVGRICFGGICFGTLPVGLAALGPFSIGIIALGGFAAGILALGGFALGLCSFGGFAAGVIAGGGFAYGFVAMGGHIFGQYMMNMNAASAEQIISLIRQAYPHISNWILNIIVFFRFFYT